MDASIDMYFQADGEDDLKKRQLMELAIINGTYRDSTTKPGKFVTISGHPQYLRSV